MANEDKTNSCVLCVNSLRHLRLHFAKFAVKKSLSFKIQILVFILTLIFGKTECQEINLPERISEIAEEIAAEDNDPGNTEIYSDILYELSFDPVKINSGNEVEISRLFFLTDFQVKILADYVRTSGRIVSVFEIANIPGFDREVAEMMVPFITLTSFQGITSGGSGVRQSFLGNFTIKTTEADTSALGSQWKILTKYKISYKSLTAGFTTEKDPGEKYFSTYGPTPDFLSGFVSYRGRGLFRQIIIGDYSARFGQGTNINTQMRTSLSATSTSYLSGRNEIRPYTSTDENRFFRGAGAELTYKNIDLDLFLSFNRIDANTFQDSDSGTSVRSVYTSGLHNSPFYLAKKDLLSETDYGIHLSANFKSIRLGIVYSETKFSSPLIPDLSVPENRFDFSGSGNKTGTLYLNGLFKRFLFFSELSSNENGNLATIQGISFRPGSRLNADILYRYYSSGFTSFRGKGPARSSSNNNETGVFEKITFEAARYLFFSACADLCYYPWLSYRCSSPSLAKRYDLRVKYIPSGKLSMEAVFSSKTSLADNTEENQVPTRLESVTESARLSVKYSPYDYLTFSTQTGYKTARSSGSSGLLILQDVILKPEHLPLSLSMRYAIFNTGGYESGIYTWEQDLMNSFSIPVMYGSGSRSYIVVSWKIFKKAEFRFKYGITSNYGLNNNVKNIEEFRIQARINL
jgi:hypothetical protein